LAALVARGAPPAELFSAFADEIGRLLPGDRVGMARYEPDGRLEPVAAWSRAEGRLPADACRIVTVTELGTEVMRSGVPARSRAASPLPGARADGGTNEGLCAAVASPITVEGVPWGVLVACAEKEASLPESSEERLQGDSDLMATVIANAESRAALAASRARIVAASDEVRRGIERDLHDGAQQKLVSLALDLRAAQSAVPHEMTDVRAELSRVADGMAELLDELRRIARGVHPAILDAGGLGPAIKMLARRSNVPVDLHLHDDIHAPKQVEVAAYYVVSESLTNVAKHAQASAVRVEARTEGDKLRVFVQDDGVGGAEPRVGSGLLGLADRVEALGGSFSLASAHGKGTTLEVDLPLT
jgi:signal transduction histidine kinase